METPVLETFDLTKRYGRITAVRDLNLRLRRGEIYGFLGRNGAGKTTTIRLILNLARPSSGEVRLFGRRLGPNAHRDLLTRVGAMVENPGFYGNHTARENLEMHRHLMGVADRTRTDQTLETVGLLEEGRRKVGEFSTGMKQRLGVARALLHEPELLVLDEPATGLDPAAMRELRLLLTGLARERGTAIFLSSHILSEVQQVATRIGFIHRGLLVDELSPDELAHKARRHLLLQVDDAARTAWVLEEKLDISDFQVQPDGRVRIFTGLDRSAEINRALVTHDVQVTHLAVSRDTLEDYFIALTGGENHAAPAER